ncbi:conserved virulence factor C family protein [Alkalibacillus sp. S2W]|uniref:conserved virulence factor C family protein n=1 Tax=Alkalibacillus sp. S2W TaxID=3386553 RepID=UPI00398CE70C
MKIKSIEPTPSPYSMKINVDERLSDMETQTYTQNDDLTDAPSYVSDLMAIEGVKELYRVIDFIALERHPKVEWETILPQVEAVLGSADHADIEQEQTSTDYDDEAFGGVQVYIQQFRGVPMQVKLIENDEEQRFGLPQRFTDAAMEASKDSANMLMEREWIEQDPRYGHADDIGQDVVEEIDATYPDKRLRTLVDMAQSGENDQQQGKVLKPLTEADLELDDWKSRYAALDRIPDPTTDDLPILGKALKDPKMSIRRLATAYLGMVEEKATLPYLYEALQDKTVTVRRTAGDCLSDIGFTDAIPQMIDALQDKSRIVRWRAAMFLYEYGDESAIPALQDTLEDPEFEVRMQAKMAFSRIQEGESAQGSIWKQMAEMTKQKDNQS